MKIQFTAILSFAILLFTACDSTTDGLGSSLTRPIDELEISTDTFQISTRSIAADSVFSRNITGYLGKVRDPETGVYITGNFMSQFHIQENYAFPDEEKMISRENNEVVADSCELRLYYQTFYGDSLAPMKLTVYEMDKPMNENRTYYSNFDPIKEGYVRTDAYQADKTYTMTDLSVAEKNRWNKNYVPSIRIKLNHPYTAKDGKQYKNYGSYIINQYYRHKEYFKNSFNFTQNVVPGFYFKNVSGLGSMAYIHLSQLNIYFRFKNNDSIYSGTASFSGTEEVLQTSNINNDKTTIGQLVANQNGTYLKAPAGIFTEITIPVEQILKGHEKDSINAAKIQLRRINNTVNSDYSLDTPKTLLLVRKDSLYSFFEHRRIADFKTSFLATYSSANNSYTFNNIGSLIKEMGRNKATGKQSTDWNKVVIIPVTTSYYSYNNTNILTRVVHDMSLSSTRLFGGQQKQTISVIYSHFK